MEYIHMKSKKQKETIIYESDNGSLSTEYFSIVQKEGDCLKGTDDATS